MKRPLINMDKKGSVKALYVIHFKYKYQLMLKVNQWKIHAIQTQGMIGFGGHMLSRKGDFRVSNVTIDKQAQLKMIKE